MCPVHGRVEFRIHKRGTYKDGRPRYQSRCPTCHSERNARYAKA